MVLNAHVTITKLIPYNGKVSLGFNFVIRFGEHQNENKATKSLKYPWLLFEYCCLCRDDSKTEEVGHHLTLLLILIF